MTNAKKQEIKYTMQLQALFAHMNNLQRDLIKIESEIESRGKVKIGWKDGEGTLLEKSEKMVNKNLYLKLFRARLLKEIENITTQIETL